MKELTIEQKARAYDEALARARKLQENSNGMILKKWLWNIFSELKESEDEKIRKALIRFHKSTIKVDGIKGEDIIAWLEKQGEQKPTLPKWKYKNDNTPLLRDSLILNKYGCVAKSPSGAFVNDVWVIDYDELAKLPKEELEKQGEQETLCDKCRKEHPSHSCQDITELGRCSVEHEQDTDNSYCQENCKGFQETGKCFADGDCKAKREVKSTNKVKQRSINEIEIPFGAKDSELQQAIYHIPKGFHAEIDDDKVVIKKGEKPAAWSEDDEHRVKDAIYFLGTAKKHYASTVELDGCIDWLKSLKQRRIGG